MQEGVECCMGICMLLEMLKSRYGELQAVLVVYEDQPMNDFNCLSKHIAGKNKLLLMCLKNCLVLFN